MRHTAIPLILVALTGCNQYDLFRVAGYEQASFSNEADILFIVDNSPSMVGESEALALNFNVFLDALIASEGGDDADGSLSDAVGGYITYVTDRGAIIDYQMGITTTSVDTSGSPGDAGDLVGDPRILVKGEGDVAQSFITNLACEAVCWKECTTDTEREETGDCIEEGAYDPDNLTEITIDYLHDTCGVDEWDGNCGSGNEEHIEAALLSLCRAVENPPEFCFDAITNLTEAEAGTNSGLLREGATALIVILTDEGDSSRRLTTGETDPTAYLELFDAFDIRYRFAVIGPPFEAGSTDQSCIAGAQPWGVERLYNAAEATDGFYRWLWGKETEFDPKTGDEECTYAAEDFSSHLEELGQLLNSLLTYFPLQSVPDPSTIRAFINDEEIDAATLDDVTGEWSDGWSYDPAQNAIEFHGSAVPEYNAEVRIYYLPLEGMPRELPF